jgi:O-antigen/teichoic acid export membrane protein
MLLVNLVGNFWLMPLYGTQGAALTLCAAVLVGVVMVWILIWHFFGLLPAFAHLFGYLALGLIMALVVRALPAGNWWQLGYKVLAGVTIYLAGIWVFRRWLLPPGESASKTEEAVS